MNRIDYDYMQLKTMIANMCYIVSSMLEDTSKAIMEQNEDLAANVMARDKEVDKLDLQIDNYCLKLLAIYAPKAAELRYVVAALRIVIDIERIGDHCRYISKQISKHHFIPVIQYTEDFTSLLSQTNQMLQDSFTSIFEQNVDKAAAVIANDKVIDKLHNRISRNIVAAYVDDISKARLLFSFRNIVRRYERIADHAKNIAEAVPYIVNGRTIRHHDINTSE
ncbi:MAG: phosphate signaling complex protein PhoU [Deferribacteraceae bacterium]|jgi:phosphate transport system protein|nr:phosphate signaling complex protein PhoU [Deferribacteraceae bacterium]